MKGWDDMIKTDGPWDTYVAKAVHGDSITMEEGLAVLQAEDDELLPLMEAAFQVRKHYFGKKASRLNSPRFSVRRI